MFTVRDLDGMEFPYKPLSTFLARGLFVFYSHTFICQIFVLYQGIGTDKVHSCSQISPCTTRLNKIWDVLLCIACISSDVKLYFRFYLNFFIFRQFSPFFQFHALINLPLGTLLSF